MPDPIIFTPLVVKVMRLVHEKDLEWAEKKNARLHEELKAEEAKCECKNIHERANTPNSK